MAAPVASSTLPCRPVAFLMPLSAARAARASPSVLQRAAAAAAATAGAGRRRQAFVRAASAVDAGRGSTARSGASSSSSDGRANGGAAGSADPLLRSIAAAASAEAMHALLLRHSAELGGREVALALQTAAQRKLLRGTRGAEPSSTGGSGSNGNGASGGAGAPAAALAQLLVALAAQHAGAMPPPALSAAAWSLAALELGGAWGALRDMHDQAARQLTQFSPAQLCMLLWAGGALDPGFHSPLFQELWGLVQGGMTLELFSTHDLAVLAWLCGREGSGMAKKLLRSVADECRTRVEMYNIAAQRLNRQAAAAEQAAAEAATAAGGPQAAADLAQQRERARRRPPRPRGSGPPPPPPGSGLAPPFGPAEAAMLLTGLAEQRLRVGGLVEPMLQQCEPHFAAASPNDLARILVALGDLHMEIAPELFSSLAGTLAACLEALAPQQVTSSLWACLRLGAIGPQGKGSMPVALEAVRHYAAHHGDYGPADTAALLWALPQFHKTLPDSQLLHAARSVRPHLHECSPSALTQLISGLCRAAAMRWARGGREAGAANGQHPPTSPGGGWLASKTGAEVVATTAAALQQLVRRLPQMRGGEVAAAVAALGAHAPLAAALPAAPVAALRRACAAALEEDQVPLLELGQLAAAAARLSWKERRLLDSLAACIAARSSVAATLPSVFCQLVCALGALAPARYGALWSALAAAFAAKVGGGEAGSSSRRGGAVKGRLAAHFAPFDKEERQAIIAAFAAAAKAQTLPREDLLSLLGTCKLDELQRLSAPPPYLLSVLALAERAQLEPSSPLLRALCSGLQRSLPVLSHDECAAALASLRRLPGSDLELQRSLEERMEALGLGP